MRIVIIIVTIIISLPYLSPAQENTFEFLGCSSLRERPAYTAWDKGFALAYEEGSKFIKLALINKQGKMYAPLIKVGEVYKDKPGPKNKTVVKNVYTNSPAIVATKDRFVIAYYTVGPDFYTRITTTSVDFSGRIIQKHKVITSNKRICENPKLAAADDSIGLLYIKSNYKKRYDKSSLQFRKLNFKGESVGKAKNLFRFQWSFRLKNLHFFWRNGHYEAVAIIHDAYQNDYPVIYFKLDQNGNLIQGPTEIYAFAMDRRNPSVNPTLSVSPGKSRNELVYCFDFRETPGGSCSLYFGRIIDGRAVEGYPRLSIQSKKNESLVTPSIYLHKNNYALAYGTNDLLPKAPASALCISLLDNQGRPKGDRTMIYRDRNISCHFPAIIKNGNTFLALFQALPVYSGELDVTALPFIFSSVIKAASAYFS